MRDDMIRNDLNRYYDKIDQKHFRKAFFLLPGFRFSYFLRKAAYARKGNPVMYFIYRFFHHHYSIKYSIDIPVSTKIGKGFFIGHLGNVVINGATVIGNYCNIAQGVTIGQTNRGAKEGCPQIGDCVWIGANAVIVGKIKIGNDVMIAPLTFVNDDIPDHSIVIGNPMKIIPKAHATEGYIINIL